jgi:undecaprenyl-diphosphatase
LGFQPEGLKMKGLRQVLMSEQGDSEPKVTFNTRRFFSTFLLTLKQLGWIVVAALIIGMGMLFVFVWLSEEVFSNEFANLDKNVLLGIHTWSNSFLDGFFIFFTLLGSTIGVIIISVLSAGLLLWRKHFYGASLFILVVAGGALLNFILKEIFKRTRPGLFTGPIAEPASYSYPSGHATLAVCVYGVLIYLGFKFLKRTLFRVLVAILGLSFIILIGMSRVYLGVHYPTDVLAGYISAGCWLGVILGSGSIARQFWKVKSKINTVTKN